MKMEAEIKQYHKRGLWTEEEDRALLEHIKAHGIGQWNRIPKLTGLKRCGKSCRLRWLNYLSPNVKRGGFSEEEDDLIIRLHKLLGNRWALIAGRVPGRTDNQVKNHWNTHLSKKLGITSTKKQSRKVLFHNVIMSKQKLVSTNINSTPTTNISDQPIDSHNTIAMTPVEEAGGQNCNVIMGRALENNNIVVANDQGKPEEFEVPLECARNEIFGPESPLMMRDDRDFSDIILSSNPGNSIVEFLDGFCIPELDDDHQMYWHYF